MLRKRIIVLTVLCIASILSVLILGWISEYKKNLATTFVRKIPPFKVTADNVKNIKNSHIYIAGRNENHLYLGDRIIKNRLYDLDLRTFDTSTVYISSRNQLKIKADAFVKVVSNDVYLFDGTDARTHTGLMSEGKFIDSLVCPFYTAGIPLSNKSFLFRSIEQGGINVLIKQITGDSSLAIKKDILTKQVDGFFCTDGMMVKVPHKSLAFYVYYYRNQFIAMDSNLNVLYRGKTLDTNSVAKLTVKKIQSLGQTTLASPPLYVSRRASANSKYLFIQSALKADNETKELHEKTSAIDVYSVKDGAYQFSFYIPHFAKEKLTDFQVYDDILVGVFGQYVYTLKLNF